ncbi:nucleoside deaminase [Janibacter alittae]|uniref:tRNA-specific adenosine deaminase n=1 Tax=Janibacter alittae TaxID=3115209 RepID=A0ABZ2MM30_9MICO
MDRALQLGTSAVADGDIPVGALVVDADGAIIGEGRNTRERDGDPTGHAEVVALRAAAEAKGEWRLTGCTLVVTLEPCPMCAGAVVASRVPRVVLGAWDPKMGACGSVWDIVRDRQSIHRAEVVGGVREEECAAVLLDFFARQRAAH